MSSPTPTNAMRNKLSYIVSAVIIVFAVYVSVILVNTSIVNADKYRARANSQQMSSLTLTANRGTIYDTNGKILAQSQTVWTIILSPGTIHDDAKTKKLTESEELAYRQSICKTLADILDVDYDKLMEKSLNYDNRYYIVKTKVEKPEVDRINQFKTENSIGADCIQTLEGSKRTYPNDSLAATVIGFTNYDNVGVYGIEAYYDDYLQGNNGRIVMAQDAAGNAMPYEYEARYDAEDGNSLTLTIDEVLQHYLEKNLDTTISQFKVANRATGIIMNCKTGAILAMATSPGFDLNYPSTLSDMDMAYIDSLTGVTPEDKALEGAADTASADNGEDTELTDEQKATEEFIESEKARLRELQWKNKAISELYFPGSVFKVITCASAVEEELVNLNSEFTCSGVVKVADTYFHCWSRGGHGTLNLTQAITKSCNPAFIKIGQLLGADKFCGYFESFGFTERTGIDLPGEAQSLYVPRDNMGIVELASSSFGQTNKITPLQMICAYNAAINGGYLVTPHVVEKITDSEGNVIKSAETEIKRQVVSADTSELMRSILKDVVTTNGGSNAYIAGYSIGGKSGTSQKLDEYDENHMRYVSTFCAFTPAEDPEIIMLVAVDEPLSGQYYGSAVAAPVVSNVFKECLEYLEIYPQYTADELAQQDTTVPYVIGSASLTATTTLNTLGLNARFVGSETGTTVIRTVPAAGQSIPKSGTVVLYMEEQDYITATVPSVLGCTVAQANTAITNAGLNIKLSGGAVDNANAKATSQSLEAGTEVHAGTVVEVTFALNDETG